MKKFAIVLAGCMAMVAMLAYAQSMDPGYEMARVVSFEKMAVSEQHPEYGDQYKMAMRMGNTIYMCQGSASAEMFLDWAPNKEFPAKLINDKTMSVKGPHGEVQLTIKGKKTPK